ncbi:MAG TPA: M48 family metallopeptidase [Pyrinomonadaceae bacterium]|nr:M48 family metallopeptidase [Pyrinomonadaceae bacterium]
MIRNKYQRSRMLVTWLAVTAIFAMPLSVFPQTRLKLHSNKYSVQDDIKLGRQAAAEAEQQFPLLRDGEVQNYVERVGSRLVASIPSEFRHPGFQYTFKVINARDINAFALPGGPMYINRGMIEAARREGEMAGVMAHEISHVALRHGTAQATKGQKYGTLAGILGIAGQIIGGPAGAAAQIAGQGVGVYFLKFSREYETEADILGAQILARSGYDPRDLAAMFQTIERQGGGSGGGFLSSHPSPQNRYARINQEAQYLRVENPIGNTAEFARIQSKLRGYGSAPSMAEIARSGQRYPSEGGNYPQDAPGGRVDYPSTRYRSYNELGFLTVSVPDNWRKLGDNNSIWFSPEGGYGQYQNQAVFTHGVNFGVAQTQGGNLRQATEQLINSLAQGNRNLRQSTNYQRVTVSGRAGLSAGLANVNEATGQTESITLITTQLRNGALFYMVAVAPQSEARSFAQAFNNTLRSIRIND